MVFFVFLATLKKYALYKNIEERKKFRLKFRCGEGELSTEHTSSANFT